MKRCIGCGAPSTTAFCAACDAEVTARLEEATPALVIGIKKSGKK